MQFQDGTRLPTTYAFALVENCQNDRFRLRMYLAGEVEHYNTDVVKSCQRLLNMRSLITSPTSEVEKLFYSLKVSFFSFKLWNVLRLATHVQPFILQRFFFIYLLLF